MTEQAGGASRRPPFAWIGVVLVAAGCVLLALWIRNVQNAAEEGLKSGVGALQGQVSGLQEKLDRATADLETTRGQLAMIGEIKTGLDTLVKDMSARMQVVEEAAPEQEKELDEFALQMTEIQRSLGDLASAVAVLRSERVTQEQLDRARQQIERSIDVVGGGLKKLDRMQARLTGRVKTLERNGEEAVKAIEDLSKDLWHIRNLVDETRKEVSTIKAPKKPDDRLDFRPSEEPAGEAGAAGGQPVAEPAGEPATEPATEPAAEPAPEPAT